MASTRAKHHPSTFASASIWFTQEEWTRINLAVARSGKSRRRFMLDSIRAASGMPASVPLIGPKKKSAAVSTTATPEVDPGKRIEQDDPVRNRHG
jgi:hypothetical protein